jgi:hypothetical protein
MFYRAVKGIGEWLARHNAILATILAAALAVIDAFFVDPFTGQIQFQMLWSGGAIVNYILLVAIGLLFVCGVFARSRQKILDAEANRRKFDNICEQVFVTLELSPKFRVSLFEENDGALRITGRFAKFHSELDTDVRFKTNMGCVGIAYHSGEMNVIDDLPAFDSDPEKYYDTMKKKGNMDRADVDKLHWKNRSYFSHPVTFFGSQQTAAVLCVDCVDAKAFTEGKDLVDKLSNFVTSIIAHMYQKSSIYA